jgi:hypothetical protein
VYYPHELQSFRNIRLRDPSGATTDLKLFLLGEASVKLFGEALALLFARIVRVPSTAPGSAIDGGPVAVIEPRIVSATQQIESGGPATPSARTTLVYELRLYSTDGQPLATWTVTGVGAATSGIFTDPPYKPSIELAMRDAAFKLTSGFRDFPGVRRWVEERGVR